MFVAKYRFKCAGCGNWYPAGTNAEHDQDGVLHAAHNCAEVAYESQGADFDSFTRGRSPGIAVLPRGTTAKDKCTQCFIVHAPGQKGCE